MWRVAIYGREAPGRAGRARLDRQVNALAAQVTRQPGWQHVATYGDQDFDVGRPGLFRLLDEAPGRIDLLVVAGFDQAWLAVAHGVAQSGLPTVLLGTITPDRVQSNVGRKWVGGVHALLLDCPDEIRRQRIEPRPSWRLRDVTDQIDFGRWLRETITNQVDTSRGTPEAAARAVVDWIEGVLTAKT